MELLQVSTWRDVEEFFSDMYLDRRPKTWKKLRQAIRLMAAHCPEPRDFSARSVALLKNSYAQHRSPWSVKTMLQTIRTVSRSLVKMRVIAHDPFAVHNFIDRKIRGAKQRSDQHLPIDAVLRIFEKANAEVREADEVWASFQGRTRRWHANLAWRRRLRAHKVRAYLAIVAYTAVRAGEALWLRRRDIDLDAGIIEVGRNHQVKTFDSEAPVGCPAELVVLLRQYLRLLDEYFPGGQWLFPLQTRDAPWVNDTGSSDYRPTALLVALGRRAGLDRSTALALRHSFVTHGKQVFGLSAEQVRAQVRHTTTRTQEHYEHRDLANLQAIASRIQFGVVWPDEKATAV